MSLSLNGAYVPSERVKPDIILGVVPIGVSVVPVVAFWILGGRTRTHPQILWRASVRAKEPLLAALCASWFTQKLLLFLLVCMIVLLKVGADPFQDLIDGH